MPEVDAARLEQLEEVYDQRGDPLISATHLILTAHEELQHCGGGLERKLRDRLAEILETAQREAFRRLDDALTTMELTPPRTVGT